MNFVQSEFLWFIAMVFTLYWAAQRRTWQNVVLLIASAIFYGFVHWWFLILLYSSATLDFFLGHMMVRRPKYKSYLLIVSVAANLGVLAYFKYFNFFVENVTQLAENIGLQANLSTLAFILPVGISFYTFQTMSYTIDIYRGDLKPRKSFWDYLVFVSFFPQLVAGPIERAARLLPQVETPRVFVWKNILSGLSLAMWGGFKKICLADTIAPYVDKVFILEDPSGPMIWAASIGFMMQIFADFSGYTDIARGTARMLGFELVENFKSPFLAATTPEFWQRWHISLSFWIRDYIMVPLLGSGSHLSMGRFVAATLITFTAIGFWHGASWNFILFGIFHGVWMTVYTLGARQLPDRVKNMPYGRPIAVAFHMLLVSIPGSMLFRETHIHRLFSYLQKNPFSATSDEWVATSVIMGMVAFVSVPLIFSYLVERYLLPRVTDTDWMLPLQTSSWAVLASFMFVFYRISSGDFIYFQF
ncbi:MAG: MBOAT family protein [Rhodobacterales bacterium]|nr:MBOAT family protein [Rhodobacterales bacterium]